HGWTFAEQQQAPEGIAEIKRGLDALQATEARIFRPYTLCLLAEAYGRAEQPREGLLALTEAMANCTQNEDQFWEAELHRLRGELLLMERAAAEAEIEACFQRAIEVAQRQRAKSLELRATTSLARLWQKQGRDSEARLQLAAVYDWFSEGFSTYDLKQ